MLQAQKADNYSVTFQWRQPKGVSPHADVLVTLAFAVVLTATNDATCANATAGTDVATLASAAINASVTSAATHH